MAVLLAVLLASPQIERIEPVHGGYARRDEWSAALVHLRSETKFDGVVEIQTDLRTQFRVPVKLAAGGAASVFVPFVTGGARPVAVLRRGDKEIVRKDFPDSWRMLREGDLLVGIAPDAPGKPDGLPRVIGRARVFELIKTPPHESWLHEPLDVLIGGSGEGMGAWKMLGGVHWKDARDIEARLENVYLRRKSRITIVDETAWNLAPEAGWSDRRRNFIVLFAVIYAFAAFVTLFWVARRGGKVMLFATLVVLSAAFSAGGWLLFPAGRISVSAHEFDYRHSDGSGASVHLLFASTTTAGEGDLQFDRWVRPVFRSLGDSATTPVVIEYGETGSCTVRWKTTGPRVLGLLEMVDAAAPDAALSVQGDGPPFELTVQCADTLREANALVRRYNTDLGVLKGGASRAVRIEEDGGAPKGNEFGFLRHRLYDTDEDNFLFGHLEVEGAYTSVDSPDLLESVRLTRYFVARFRDK